LKISDLLTIAFPYILFATLLLLRPIFPYGEFLLILLPYLFFLRNPPSFTRGFILFLLFSLYTFLTTILPHPSLPPRFLPFLPPDTTPTLSLTPWETREWVVRFLGVSGWFLLAEKENRTGRRIVTLLLSLYGIVFFVLSSFSKLGFISYKTPNPNHLALLYLIALVDPLLRAFQGEKFYFLFLLPLTFGIVEEKALFPIALMVSLYLYGILSRFFPSFFRSSSLVVIPIAGGVLISILSLFFPETQTSISNRIVLWKEVLPMVKDFFPFGGGWGSFPYLYPAYTGDELPVGIRALHPENLYLYLLAEGGVVPFLIGALFILFYRKKTEGTGGRSARTALLLIFLQGCIDTPILWGGILYPFALLLSIGFRSSSR